MRTSPVCPPEARQPPPPTLVSMLLASGTSAITVSSIWRKTSSISSRRVPTDISALIRTSPSSERGSSSEPMYGTTASDSTNRATAPSTTRVRWARALERPSR
jgi:hypothetical protein